jgi:hypothetical protein
VLHWYLALADLQAGQLRHNAAATASLRRALVLLTEQQGEGIAKASEVAERLADALAAAGGPMPLYMPARWWPSASTETLHAHAAGAERKLWEAWEAAAQRPLGSHCCEQAQWHGHWARLPAA